MKTHYSCAELAALKLPGYPFTKKGWYEVVERESWPFVEEKSRGRAGATRRYMPSKAVHDAIRIQSRAAKPGLEQAAAKALCSVLAKMEADEAITRATRHAKAEEALKALAGGLSDNEELSFRAHCEIAEGWTIWFAKQQPLRKSKSWEPYAHAYNLAEIPVTKVVRGAYPEVSPRSVQRWVGLYEKGDFEALIDRRNGDKRRGDSHFAHWPLLAAAAKKIMIDRPGIKTGQLHDLLVTAAIDLSTGEALFNAPSYHQVYRFQKAWVRENEEVWLAATNPDAWKNSKMLALGDASEDVVRLNQRWEMDATPADWMLLDEDGQHRRYTCSVVIDVYSRRMIVVLARTPKAQTHAFCLRLALMKWGVPEEIVTDNGKDYQAKEFKRVLSMLDIEHYTTGKFSPWEKPHVERGIQTLLHSILELLPNFVGHSVADRQAIEARKSFAERLFEKDAVAEIDMSPETLQHTINQWLQGSYEHDQHGSLGTTPYLLATAWTDPVRRIDDERALDILLARPAGNDGIRTLQKKGIQIDNAWFISVAFGDIDVGSPLEVFETDDLGRVIVYHDGQFLCVAECHERTGNDRREIALIAKQKQKTRIQDARQEIKRAAKGRFDTNELLAEHLRNRAEAAGKLATLPRPADIHTSAGLQAAAQAAHTLRGTPPESTATAEDRARAVELLKEPEQTVVQLRDEPTPAQKFQRWLGLNAIADAGGALAGDDLKFWSNYQKSNEFRSQQRLHQEKSQSTAAR